MEKYFNQKNKLNLKNKFYLQQLEQYLKNALFNDLAGKKDLTSDILIKQNKVVKAAIYAKEEGIIAGLDEICWILKKYKIYFKKHIADGEKINKNHVILELKGKIKDILLTERLVLNLLQRMSGIATDTYKYTKKVKHRVLICSTRKNVLGLLDKKAVVLGGGGTHRLGLYDFVLIKDNHLQYLDNTIEKKAKYLNDHKIFWEIEIKNEKEFYSALILKPKAIMFDNFKPKHIKKIIKSLNIQQKNIYFEASGNINFKNVKKYSKTGVDVISIGSLTHSSAALDISLDLI